MPAGHSDGGQWTDSGGGGGGAGGNDPRVISDATPDNNRKPGQRYAQVSPRRGSRAAAAPADVVLPDGSKIPDDQSPTGYMQSPVADLSAVAEAGRNTGVRFEHLRTSPEDAPAAIPYLLGKLYRDLKQGGTFDYQRDVDSGGGYIQLRHYRNVSNFNVGLYCQQAGLSLHETLTIAGPYARFFSSNADRAEPYGLSHRTRRYTEYGFRAGERGIFGRAK